MAVLYVARSLATRPRAETLMSVIAPSEIFTPNRPSSGEARVPDHLREVTFPPTSGAMRRGTDRR